MTIFKPSWLIVVTWVALVSVLLPGCLIFEDVGQLNLPPEDLLVAPDGDAEDGSGGDVRVDGGDLDASEISEVDMSTDCPDLASLIEGVDLGAVELQFSCAGALAECCPDNTVCDGERCVCPEGLADCDGNPLNGCECEGCTLPRAECDGDPNTFCETNLANDQENCGLCGRVCPTLPDNLPSVQGLVCEVGRCVLVCEDGFADCDGLPETGCETDLRTANDHCGGCGIVCSGIEVCEEGVCECTRGELGSVSSCGACGESCPGDQGCFEVEDGRDGDQAYECRCSEGEILCVGECVSIESDDRHCGGCNMPCGQLARCDGGVCRCSNDATTDCRDPNVCCGSLGCQSDPTCPTIGCGSNETKCGNTCVSDLNTDLMHCGGCDNACASNETCVMGQCVCGNDSTGRQPCRGELTCLRLPGSLAPSCGCAMGESCPPLNSCFDTLTDPQHCGDCLTSCSGGPNVDPNGNTQCVLGRCQLACTRGFADCDSDPKTGCEADIDNGTPTAMSSGVTLLTHCGQCGVTCALDQECKNGRCQCINGGQRCNMLGSCVDTNTNPNHCGSCGNACGRNEACSNGSCVCAGVPCGGLCCKTTCLVPGVLCL